MKERMSSFDIAAMVKELQCLIGGRIDKAYQPSRDKLLLRIRVPEVGRKNLVIVVGKWLYLATQDMEMPKTPTSFAMLLRKYLSNGKITKIEQHGFDRIVVLEVEKAENFQLICEMFREGNVVLVHDGNIIQPLIPKSWSHRVLRAHREYEPPPTRHDPKTLNFEDFEDILNTSKKDIVRTLAIDVNLGGQYAEEICLLSGIEKATKARELSEIEKKNTFESARQLFLTLSEATGGVLIFEGANPKDIAPFKLKSHEGYKSECFDNLSTAIEKFLECTREEEPLDPEYQDLKARYRRKFDTQEKAIASLEKKAEENKKKAELIYVHYQECEKILNILKTGIKDQSIAELTKALEEEDSFTGLEPDKGEVTISLRDEEEAIVDIKLDFRRSVNENAGMYYDRTKKMKEKLEGAKKSLENTKEQLTRIGIEKEERKRKVKKQTKQFWFERYRWFISSDGNIVVAGRDAKTNDKVTKKYLSDKDRYAHAEIRGAPSVVVKNLDGDISDQTLKEACEYALAYSKAWNAKIGSGTAYWVLPGQVSKTPPKGEFIPKGAFIIRGKKNFTTKIELRMAVGKMDYEGEKKAMCGPVSAVETHCESYIVFGPGDMKKNDFARKLSKIFDVEQDELMRILPPGNVRIIRTTGVSDDMI